MVGTTMKILMDENASERLNQVQAKKMTVTSIEATTKRAALGELQNRGLNRAVSTKDAASKEIKDIKLTKARVDTHWKKQPLGTSNTNAVPAKAAPLLRSNSVRLNAASGAAVARPVASNVLQATRPVAGTTSQATRNAVAATTTTMVNTNVAAEAKNKLGAAAAQQKSTSDEKLNTLRREDSNLSRKSLTKLRAAIAKQNVPAATVNVTNATKSTTAAVGGLVKKDVVPVKKDVVPVKKDVVPVKKDAISVLARQPKLPTVAVSSIQSTALTQSSARLADIEDIDADDKDNLILVSEYVNDIYDYLYQLETQQPVHKDHLANQLDVSHKMRAVLIDWINEVHLQFHLAAETFHMSVAIIDRYLQVVKNTKRKYLQLVGVTALFIATKYEELFPPALSDFVFITDDTYSAREICQMELQILKTIDMNLSRPLPIHFLRRYSKAAGAEDEHHAMSKYFLELAAVDYDLASHKPSEVAAASLFLSLHLLNGNARAATGFSDKHWTPTLIHYSRYTAAHLRPIAQRIAKLARNAPLAKLKAVFNKYQGNKFHKIALRSELSGPLIDSIVGNKKF